MPVKKYSLGQLLELGLIKNPDGSVVKQKNTIKKILEQQGIEKTGKTPYGQPCFSITQAQINKINKRFYGSTDSV